MNRGARSTPQTSMQQFSSSGYRPTSQSASSDRPSMKQASVIKQAKICLLGDFAVGKTSLIQRFIENTFDDKYLSTIGAKISRKRLTFDGEATTNSGLTLLVWDLVGGEVFDRVMMSYYRGAAGAILVCDLTRHETLEAIPLYAQDFTAVNPGASLIIVGNKSDLPETQWDCSENDLAQIADQCNATYTLCSAKIGTNVETTFQNLGRKILST